MRTFAIELCTPRLNGLREIGRLQLLPGHVRAGLPNFDPRERPPADQSERRPCQILRAKTPISVLDGLCLLVAFLQTLQMHIRAGRLQRPSVLWHMPKLTTFNSI